MNHFFQYGFASAGLFLLWAILRQLERLVELLERAPEKQEQATTHTLGL